MGGGWFEPLQGGEFKEANLVVGPSYDSMDEHNTKEIERCCPGLVCATAG